MRALPFPPSDLRGGKHSLPVIPLVRVYISGITSQYSCDLSGLRLSHLNSIGSVPLRACFKLIGPIQKPVLVRLEH